MKQKLKQTSKQLLILLVLFILSTSAVFAAAKTAVREYNFTTNDKNLEKLNYTDNQEITIDGKKYEAVDIKYEIVSKKEKVTKKVNYADLTEKRIPKTMKKNGVKLTLEDVEWTENKEEQQRSAATGTVTYTGYDSRPDAPATKEITATLPDGTKVTVTGHLTGIKQSGSSFSKPFTVSGKFTGDPDVSYYMLGDIRWPNNPDSPAFDGYETIIERYLGLGSNYQLTSAAWDGDYRTEKGKTVRYATFSGLRRSQNWTATYAETLTANSPSYSTSTTTYNAVAMYSNGVTKNEYEVKAIVTYEKKGWSLLQKILAATVGIAVVAIVIGVILAILRKKRKEEPTTEKSL